MRTRILLTALAVSGLWAAPASAQFRLPFMRGAPAVMRPGIMPMPAPHVVFPATAFPPVRLPPVRFPSASILPFTNSPLVVDAVAASAAAAVSATPAAPATATVPMAPSVAPAATATSVTTDLTRLEAEAAIEIPAPQVPAGVSDEARRVALATVQMERARRVLDRLTPARLVTTPAFDFANLRVGTRGWIDMTVPVVRTTDRVAILQPAAPMPEGITVGVPAGPATTYGAVRLRGEYVAERGIDVDGRYVLLLKDAGATRADPTLAEVISAARFRLESARTEYSDAVAALATAKKSAIDAALAKSSVEAAKQIPVPDNATGEERIIAKRDQDDLAYKLAKPEIDAIVSQYGDVTADLSRR